MNHKSEKEENPDLPISISYNPARLRESRKRRDHQMGGKLDPKETVSLEELLMSIVMEQEALINLLEEKGIIKKVEVLEGVKKLKPKYNM